MKKTNLNMDWLFMNGEKSNIPMMPSQTRPVDLPHDFMVETDVTPDAAGKAGSGFYKGSAGTYLKTITLTEDELADTMLLHFEGCFGKTRVLVNGNPVGSHVYGYTPFTLDIRKFLQVGDNEIQVVVRTAVRAGGCSGRDAPFGMTRCSVRGQGDKQKQMAGICPPLLRFYLILKSLRWSLPEVRCG